VSTPEARPARGKLAISEQFSSVQGEGVSAGEPCLFLRLAHCNLRCRWCDTKYSWDFEQYRFEDEVRVEPTQAVAERITAEAPRRLVVTGGEPLIQSSELEALFALLAPELVLEVETNGTLAPSARLLERVDQWNVSPKLENSGDPREKRLRPEALALLAKSARAYLKLVVTGPDDPTEAEELLRAPAWPRERVLRMPQAATRAELAARGPLVRAAALVRGLRYSSRLHVERWDGARGK
jgi:organic radical activating enzyme